MSVAKKIKVTLNDELDTVHYFVAEINTEVDAPEIYGRIFNGKTKVELEGAARAAAIRLLNKFYFPSTDPQGEYDNVTYEDLNPANQVVFS